MTKPTTTPRWLQLLTHGALIITILVGVISYGRSAGRTEVALRNYENVPKIQSNVDSLTAQLNKIEDLISKQNEKTNQTLDSQNRRIDATQQQIAGLTQQLNALNSSFGSVWALAQSDSNKMSKLEGMLTAMQLQQQQQRKDK